MSGIDDLSLNKQLQLLKEELKFSSPNIYGKWGLGNIWNLSINDLMKDIKTLETPYTYKTPSAIDLKYGDQYAKGKTTSFYGSNPKDTSTVRIYRGWPLMTLENRLAMEKAFKERSLKNAWYAINYDKNYKHLGPLTGKWWTNNPRTAYAIAGSGNKPGVLSWMDVKPKTLKNWWLKRPMEANAYLVPTNVIQSQARHIPIGVHAKDFSPELAKKVTEAKDYKRKSNVGKWFSNFKNWLKPNVQATAGAGMSMGSQSMSSPKIKGLGSAIDDPSNFYLNVNTGGLI